MNELEKKLFKMILKSLPFFLLGGLFIVVLISIVIAPVMMVASITSKIASYFESETIAEKDYRVVIDEWQAISKTSFNYDKLLMCMYVNEETDKLKALQNCVTYFDGNGNFVNPLIKVDGSEIFGVYKNEIKEWEGSIESNVFEDIRLPALYQKEHYKKITETNNTTNANENSFLKEEWILDYVEEEYYIDECDDNKPQTACKLIREEMYVYPFQMPTKNFNVVDRYGYETVDKNKSVGLEFDKSIVGEGTGELLAFSNGKVIEKTESGFLMEIKRNGFEFIVEYKNISSNVSVGKELEVLQVIGSVAGNVEIETYKIIDEEKQFFNPMILLGQPLGITGGETFYVTADDIEFNLNGFSFLPPFSEWKITCDFYRCYPGHTGVDVQPKHSRGLGENIRAGVSGKVISKGYDNISGYHVMLQDSVSGIFVKYNHLQSQSSLEVGSYINQGDVIGQEGQSGRATGPHVHIQFQSTTSRSTVLDPFSVVPNLYR